MDVFDLPQLWKYAPLVVVLLLILWAGHKGLWFWGKGVRVLLAQVEGERDQWKHIALSLLRRAGVQLPESTTPQVVSDLLREEKPPRA